MALRDIALTVLLLGVLPFIIRRPVLGAYFWVWVSVMSPHRLTWGFAYDMKFAQLIAIATLLGILFNKEPRRLPMTPVTVVLLIMILWMNVSLLFALNFEGSLFMWERVMKIMFMLFVVMYILHTKQHVQVLVCIVALSVAFFAVKGGIFTLRGGGMERVYGPAGSFIEENNALALATIMTIPLLRYLQLQVTKRWMWWALLGMMPVCMISALGSHSRGGFLAIAAMLGFLWLKTRGKVITGLALLMLVPLALDFMPQKWEERMRSIQNYEQDMSAQGRINAWMMTFNLAKDRPLVGGGFEIYNPTTFARYAPNPSDIHSAHSIWFQMLGEHGFVGLGLFLLLWFLVWRNASWIIKRTRKREGWRWAADMSSMIQVSLVGYAVGGMFLNLAYYDVPYYLLAAIVLTRVLIEKELGPERQPWFPPRPQPGTIPRDQPVVSRVPFKPPLAAERQDLEQVMPGSFAGSRGANSNFSAGRVEDRQPKF
jgi:probable O-glycosylation ligase (exosortase A-associated)